MFSKKIYQIPVLFIACVAASCTATSQLPKPVSPAPAAVTTAALPIDSTKTDAFLEDILKQYPPYFEDVLKNRKALNVQIIYTTIDKGANGVPALKQYYFNVNPGNYFNPGQAIQLPINILTLQKIAELKTTQPIERDSTIIIGKAFSGQTEVINDPTTIDGQPNIAHYLKKVLMANDSDAINRLYEFLGQQYINDQLHQRGYTQAQIINRLGTPLTAEQNKYTNPITFLGTNNKILYTQPAQYNKTTYASYKNILSLQDLNNILISLIFPSKVHAAQRFSLSDADKKFLFKYMSQQPNESRYPPYSADTIKYFPTYKKYLISNILKTDSTKSIRSFNSSGTEAGQQTDIAYIVDYGKKIEFFLSATINQKANPAFLQHLGEAIYNYELKRTHKIPSDLSSMKFEYDKK